VPSYSFHRFSEVAPAEWLTLLNNRETARHMPLSGEAWTEQAASEWAAGKDRQWLDNGYGPWAIRVDGAFAGWGGFQKEGEDADFGLVLLPSHWGHGRAIFGEIVERGWTELKLNSISILLPPSRRMKGLARLGFIADGEVAYDGHRFLKFRLNRP
jgi:RimJ/RimL family protein N-acetyltransferase